MNWLFGFRLKRPVGETVEAIKVRLEQTGKHSRDLIGLIGPRTRV